MDEIIAQVSQRTGLSPEQARQAVEVVISHLKSRLPGPLASHLDSIVGGGASTGTSAGAAQQSSGGGLGGIAGELGGLFGKK